jgi:hypothetical protein
LAGRAGGGGGNATTGGKGAWGCMTFHGSHAMDG